MAKAVPWKTNLPHIVKQSPHNPNIFYQFRGDWGNQKKTKYRVLVLLTYDVSPCVPLEDRKIKCRLGFLHDISIPPEQVSLNQLGVYCEGSMIGVPDLMEVVEAMPEVITQLVELGAWSDLEYDPDGLPLPTSSTQAILEDSV